jgi:hypothetical protein
MRYAQVMLVTALLVAGVLNGQGAAPTTLVKHYGTSSERYQYVPFNVPAGTTRLHVTYQYDKANGDNVVDLGVFEPGSLDLGTAAFRGYTGGARSEFTLTAATATQGYKPGPLPPGQWHLLLGLYKVGANGVDVTLTIETSSDAAASAPAATRPAASTNNTARRAGPAWFMGALHTHTLHSDGTISPVELIERFRALRFDFVALTDHNNTTHRYDLAAHTPAADDPLIIAGEEVTTPGGHASVWGLEGDEWVDFRVSPGDPRITDLVAAARRQNAVFSVNHPASTCVACGWTHEFVDGITGIEISNGRHGEVANAIAMWEKLLRSGRHVTAVGSSDWHSDPNPMDVANVRVYASSLTTAGVLDAIRGGHVIVMRNARDATPTVVVRAGDRSAMIGDSLKIVAGQPIVIDVSAKGMGGARLVVIDNGARQTAVQLNATGHARIERPPSAGYVRIEILDAADGAPIAITNPVYLIAQ